MADGAQRIDAIALLLVTSHLWEVKLWVSIQRWVGFITRIPLAQRLLEDKGEVVHLHPLKIHM